MQSLRVFIERNEGKEIVKGKIPMPIIDGVVRGPNYGYFLREKGPGPSGEASFARFKDGKLDWVSLPKPAQSCCFITTPEQALVPVNWPGQFTVTTANLQLWGNLWERCSPLTADTRFGDCRLTRAIDGKAHALVSDGGDGKVYMAGDNGVLISGRGKEWQVLSSGNEDIWGLAWYAQDLWASSFTGVYLLVKRSLEKVTFGQEAKIPKGERLFSRKYAERGVEARGTASQHVSPLKQRTEGR